MMNLNSMNVKIKNLDTIDLDRSIVGKELNIDSFLVRL